MASLDISPYSYQPPTIALQWMYSVALIRCLTVPRFDRSNGRIHVFAVREELLLQSAPLGKARRSALALGGTNPQAWTLLHLP